MVVSTSEGPVVLTAADLTNAAFQTPVSNPENGPPFASSADLATLMPPDPSTTPLETNTGQWGRYTVPNLPLENIRQEWATQMANLYHINTKLSLVQPQCPMAPT